MIHCAPGKPQVTGLMRKSKVKDTPLCNESLTEATFGTSGDNWTARAGSWVGPEAASWDTTDAQNRGSSNCIVRVLRAGGAALKVGAEGSTAWDVHGQEVLLCRELSNSRCSLTI